MINIAINGFGRIGRHACKVAMAHKQLNVVAINDLSDPATLAHLLSYDTVYGQYHLPVSSSDTYIKIKNKKIAIFKEKDPSKLPWKKLGIDVVIESTGIFRDKEGAGLHIQAGAKKVIISAPAKEDSGIKGFVRGVNCQSYNGDAIIDNASCTTNCTAPIVQIMEQTFGIEKAMLSTIHSYTADQNLQDGPHKDLRRARAAAQNIVPTSTGAAQAVTAIVPALEQKFDGIALRVPTITVSLTDFTFVLKKNVTKEQINAALTKAAKTTHKGIVDVTSVPLVSSDFIGNPHSATVDLPLTTVVDGNLVKIIAWYDNEWGYANRLIEMASIMGKYKTKK